MADVSSDASDDVGIDDLSVLSDQTRQLYRVLTEKAPILAQMLYGIWSGLNNATFAEAIPQIGHSARELMEKAPIHIPDVPVQQGSGTLTEEVKALHSAWLVIKANGWSGTPPWEGEIDADLNSWLEQAGTFFEGFAVSHQTRAQQIQMTITSLDQSGRSLPEVLVGEKVKEWSNLRQYFLKTAHHNIVTDKETLEQKVVELEIFLLNLLYPQPIQDMDEIEELISEGETA